MKVGCETASTNRSVPAKQASKMLYLLCSQDLVFTAIITSTFIRIVTGNLRMFRIIAVMETKRNVLSEIGGNNSQALDVN